jgi:hypothetical protein
MGDEAGESQAVTDQAIKSRSSIWKSAIVIAPLAATALFLATGTQAQTSGSTAPSNTSAASTSVTPIDAPAAARRKVRKSGTRCRRIARSAPQPHLIRLLRHRPPGRPLLTLNRPRAF